VLLSSALLKTRPARTSPQVLRARESMVPSVKLYIKVYLFVVVVLFTCYSAP
jgi:hypothetical protein